jgi:hypothetical protein
MCSGGRGTIQLRADPKDTQTTTPGLHHVSDATRGRPPRQFRNVDAPPAAVRPPPSPPCSVYQSLSIVPVGALTPPGSHGPPASGLPAPRRRAHRAPSGRRRAPGSLPDLYPDLLRGGHDSYHSLGMCRVFRLQQHGHTRQFWSRRASPTRKPSAFRPSLQSWCA